MILEITYQEMAYIRSLLQKDNPHPRGIDIEKQEKILKKLRALEKDYAEGLIS